MSPKLNARGASPFSISVFKRAAFWTLALGALGACGKIDLPAGLIPSLPAATPAAINPNQPQAPNPTPGIVDNATGFYARAVTSPNYTYYMHKGSTTPNVPCIASPGEQATCYIEAQELDLYFNGFSLQYNVPASMCTYVGFSPYWFYKWQVGVGPASVQIDTDAAGAQHVFFNGVPVASATCPFDNTSVQGPNCCVGTYSLVTRSWSATSAPAGYQVVSSTQNNSWGGNGANCIGGAAVDTQPKNQAGYPSPVIYYVAGTGINNVYTVTSPIKNSFASDVYAANYWDPASVGGGIPTAMGRPVPSVPSGVPYYDIFCYDAAQEIQSEIRVLVRKWNTSPEFKNLFNDPTQFNKVGFEGAPWATFPNNDYPSWLDFLNTYPQFGE